MFHEAGTFRVTVRNAYLAEAKFNKDDAYAFDVYLDLITDDGKQTGDWRGECSERFGVGNAANMTQTEMTLATLEKVGWPVGQEVSFDTIDGMVGLSFDAEVVSRKYNDREFFDVKYIGSSKPRKLSREDANAMTAKLFGSAKTAQTPQEDPFA